MPKITALIHTSDDESSLPRLLETLKPCDEILVIDHDSRDRSRKVAREHGSIVKKIVPGVDDGAYAVDCSHDWVLCLLPNESLSEGLAASLAQWKETNPGATVGYSIAVREKTAAGWRSRPPEMRLVNRKCINWTGKLPGNSATAAPLDGDLLRFAA